MITIFELSLIIFSILNKVVYAAVQVRSLLFISSSNDINLFVQGHIDVTRRFASHLYGFFF